MDLVEVELVLEKLSRLVIRANRSVGFFRQRNRRVKERAGMTGDKLLRARKVRKRQDARRPVKNRAAAKQGKKPQKRKMPKTSPRRGRKFLRR